MPPETPNEPPSRPTAAPAPRPLVVYGLGTALLLFGAFFGTYAYIVVQALNWAQASLQRGSVTLLFFLVLFNIALLRRVRRLALSQAELVILYGMITTGTCAGGIGFVQFLVNQMVGAFYHANAANSWREKIWPHVPAWMAPREPEVIAPFFRGNSTLYAADHLRGWALPLLCWTAFLFALFWVMLCLLTLVRRQWIEEERLTFPLVLLPLEMTRGGGAGPFWKDRWMWAGFLLAGAAESVNALNFLYPSVPALVRRAVARAAESVNALNFLYPSVPALPIKPIGPNQLDTLFTTRPWDQIGTFRLAFYPFVIGIGYLLSLDVSFSCWSFYLLVKAANVATAALGLSEGGGNSAANRAPYLREQSAGAFLGIALLSLWMARRALARAWAEAVRPTGRDRGELMPFRLALSGGAAGLLFLIGFLALAGLALPAAALFVLVYLCFALTLARIVSEVGAGWAFAPNWSPSAFTSDALGAKNLSARSLVLLHGYTSWTSDMRDNPMPQQAQGLKLAQTGGLAPRALLVPLVIASLIGILAGFWAHLHIYYAFGAASAKVRSWPSSFGVVPFQQTSSVLANPNFVDWPGLTATGAGAGVVAALSLLRQRLPWWPFNPLGYALATTQSLDYLWFPFFLAWLIKGLTLRYGGIKAYRAALPFFLGLILGDYVVPTLWGLFGMATGYQQYLAFPH